MIAALMLGGGHRPSPSSSLGRLFGRSLPAVPPRAPSRERAAQGGLPSGRARRAREPSSREPRTRPARGPRSSRSCRRRRRRSTCSTPCCRETTGLLREADAGRRRAHSPARPVPSPVSRCSSPPVVSRAAVTAPGRSPTRSRPLDGARRRPWARPREARLGPRAAVLIARSADFVLAGGHTDAVPPSRPGAFRRHGIGGYGSAAIWLNGSPPTNLSRRVRPRSCQRRSSDPDRRLAAPGLVLRAGSRSRSCSSVSVRPLDRRGRARAVAAPGAAGVARARSPRAELVHAWGADTLAPFTLRADKHFFFGEEGRASSPTASSPGWRSCRATRSASRRFPSLVARFASTRAPRLDARSARRQHPAPPPLRHPACAPTTTATRRSSTAAFSLEGRAIRKVRQSVTGSSARATSPGPAAARSTGPCRAHRDDRRPVARGAAERASSWRSPAPPSIGDDDRLRRRPRRDGRPRGFLHFGIVRAGGRSRSRGCRGARHAERPQRVADLRAPIARAASQVHACLAQLRGLRRAARPAERS